MRHRPELDGLRGIAVLIVLAAHAGAPGAANGTAGVTLFFVLSGFLITSLLLSERDRFGSVDFTAFYARRALRLLPALFAYVLVVVFMYAFRLWRVGAPDPLAVVSVLAYVGNWAMIVGGLRFGVLAHTWSLAIEEQFYLLWPALLILGLRFGGRRWIALAIVALAIAITPWRFVLFDAGALVHVANGTDTHADALLLGCAIALLGASLPSWIGWLGVAGILALGSALLGGLSAPIFLPLATVASVIAVAGCPRMLTPRPLAYIGRISYGIYLWHFLLIWSALAWPVVMAASIGVAAVSYHLLESPFLRMKSRFARDAAPAVRISQPIPIAENAG